MDDEAALLMNFELAALAASTKAGNSFKLSNRSLPDAVDCCMAVAVVERA
jgi:hypothetical protein